MLEKADAEDSVDSQPELDKQSPQKLNLRKYKKVDPLLLFEHLRNWKYDFNLSFMPQTRKEYHDPTDKYKSSVPKIEHEFNCGHNIWYVIMTKASQT